MGIFDGLEVAISPRNVHQQIEKKSVIAREYRAGAVRERIPLKQGLKLYRDRAPSERIQCQREDSIKTRIETEYNHDNVFPAIFVRERIPLKQGLKRIFHFSCGHRLLCQREDSIKTRIETTTNECSCQVRMMVRERIPLKQGLKLTNNLRRTWEVIVSERGFH